MIRKTIAFNDDLIKDITVLSKKEHRDFSNTLRYVLRIGLLAVENPELSVSEIKDILEAKIDYEMGNISEFDLNNI